MVDEVRIKVELTFGHVVQALARGRGKSVAWEMEGKVRKQPRRLEPEYIKVAPGCFIYRDCICSL